MGLYDEESDIYAIDKELLFYRKDSEPKKEKLSFKKEDWHKDTRTIVDASPGIGSNCWAVSGDLTESGKPILSCDPHLFKWLQSKWYLSRLSWKNGTEFIAGGSTPGFPLFTYARTKYIAWGVTAVNPDISDLFVEKVDGDKYFYEGEWHKFKTIEETI